MRKDSSERSNTDVFRGCTILSYLRGVSQAYVDGFEKSVEQDGGVEEDQNN